MENRSQQHHRERLTEAIKEELISILAGELRDPRIGLATVTEVVMQPGVKAIKVFVGVEGTEQEAADTLDGLRGAVGYIRHQLAEALDLRKAPDISFQLDRSEEYNARVDELLARMKKRQK